jgi:hypothetical protein
MDRAPTPPASARLPPPPTGARGPGPGSLVSFLLFAMVPWSDESTPEGYRRNRNFTSQGVVHFGCKLLVHYSMQNDR